jgi:hypothetical protein
MFSIPIPGAIHGFDVRFFPMPRKKKGGTLEYDSASPNPKYNYK